MLICAGVNETEGGATDREDRRGRLRLLAANASTSGRSSRASSPTPPMPRAHRGHGPPPGPLADLTRVLAGHDRVLSTGTTIDTLRFRVHVAAELAVHQMGAMPRLVA